MKRRLLAGLAAAAVISVGTVGGVVLAQEGEDTTTEDADSLTIYERVAGILDVDGVDADKLEAAFNQAKHDMQTDRFSESLDQLVVVEVIDQVTADEYLEWHGDRPQGLPESFGRTHFVLGKRGYGGLRFSIWSMQGEVFENGESDVIKFRHSGRQFRFHFPRAGSGK